MGSTLVVALCQVMTVPPAPPSEVVAEGRDTSISFKWAEAQAQFSRRIYSVVPSRYRFQNMPRNVLKMAVLQLTDTI